MYIWIWNITMRVGDFYGPFEHAGLSIVGFGCWAKGRREEYVNRVCHFDQVAIWIRNEYQPAFCEKLVEC